MHDGTCKGRVEKSHISCQSCERRLFLLMICWPSWFFSMYLISKPHSRQDNIFCKFLCQDADILDAEKHEYRIHALHEWLQFSLVGRKLIAKAGKVGRRIYFSCFSKNYEKKSFTSQFIYRCESSRILQTFRPKMRE